MGIHPTLQQQLGPKYGLANLQPSILNTMLLHQVGGILIKQKNRIIEEIFEKCVTELN